MHAVKPVQCRTFPFWPDILHDAKTLSDTANYCPGIGQGELVQIADAMESSRAMLEAHPTFYPALR